MAQSPDEEPFLIVKLLVWFYKSYESKDLLLGYSVFGKIMLSWRIREDVDIVIIIGIISISSQEVNKDEVFTMVMDDDL